MTLSLLQHLRETQGAGLVSETTQNYGLAPERATGFINAALALVVGRLVNINQNQGTDAVLKIIHEQDSAAIWKDIDFSHALDELVSLGNLDDTTTLEALKLVADRSIAAVYSLEQTASLGTEGINELLQGQSEHLQGHFPDWIYAAAGIPALIGLSTINTVKEGVASLSDLVRQATNNIADTASSVAQKASDAAAPVLSETLSNLTQKASDLAESAANTASEALASATQKAADIAGAATSTASEALANVTQKASDLTTSATDTVSSLASGAVDGASELAGKASAASAAAVAATTAAAASAAHAAGNLLNKTSHAASESAATINSKASANVAKLAKAPNSFFIRLLPWVALVVLALLALLFWKGCATQTVPVAATVPASTAIATPVTPETLSLHTGPHGELLDCKGIVGNADLQANFLTAIQAQFGPAATCDLKIDAAYATSFAGLAGLGEALGAIKGSPNTGVDISGDTVTVSGADQAGLAKLGERLKTLFGTGVTIVAPQDAATTVANSDKAAADALTAINPNSAKAEDVVKALNLQVINFATGSNELPAENKAILDKAATLIKAIPGLKLDITGFTDAQGDESSNKALSERRAKAVAAYLVSQGVAAGSLTAKGLGSSQPIADNATVEGRFKNRRIEFGVTGATPAAASAPNATS